MTAEEAGHNLDLSRRKLLAAAGVAPGALAAAAFNGIADAKAAASPSYAPDPTTIPGVSGLHLQFGADASSEVTVSWHTLQPVSNPRVVLGRPDGKFEQTAAAQPTSYTDGKSKQVVYAYHAKISQLHSDSVYMYGAMHDGAAPEFGTFRTSPRGRAAFGCAFRRSDTTEAVGKKFVPPAGVPCLPRCLSMTIPVRPPRETRHSASSGCGRSSTCSTEIYITPISLRTEVRTWWDFWNNNTRSARVVRGCLRPAIVRTNWATGRSAIRPIRPTSRCRRPSGQTDVTRGL